jgi:membrane protease YdiL (CAAX protease family)
MSVRAYILAPIYEEVIFRGCLTTVLISSGLGTGWATIWSSFVFGMSHIHHIRDPEVPKEQTIFQTVYSFVFSLYTNDLFISTGCLYG